MTLLEARALKIGDYIHYCGGGMDFIAVVEREYCYDVRLKILTQKDMVSHTEDGDYSGIARMTKIEIFDGKNPLKTEYTGIKGNKFTAEIRRRENAIQEGRHTTILRQSRGNIDRQGT